MKVRELMSTDVKSCPEYSTLNTAAQIMWDNDIGCLPVVDGEGRIIGMLTDRDICMSAYLEGVPLTGAGVTQAMSKRVISCRPEDEIAVAERLMRENQVHRLPVLDPEGRVVGVISLNDIAREAAREAQSKAAREVTDAEIAQALAAVCAPRHRSVEAHAA